MQALGILVLKKVLLTIIEARWAVVRTWPGFEVWVDGITSPLRLRSRKPGLVINQNQKRGISKCSGEKKTSDRRANFNKGEHCQTACPIIARAIV